MTRCDIHWLLPLIGGAIAFQIGVWSVPKEKSK